jgi:HAD superfamily hydrolase (TIGR01509 family)
VQPSPRAISFDFGNTLVPVHRAAMRAAVEQTAADVARRAGPFSKDAFMAIWREERERQFAEEVPLGREVDLEQRFARVLARLRGLPAPGVNERWNDRAAAERSSTEERNDAVEAYSAAFVAAVPVPSDVGPFLERLAERRPLAVLSNWPLAATIDRYLEAAGWRDSFRAVVISQRIGAVKPAVEMFRAAEKAFAVEGSDILHVGDDWQADIVGAKRAGWRAAYLAGRQVDSPLPSSIPDDSVVADLVLDRLVDLEAALADSQRPGGARVAR